VALALLMVQGIAGVSYWSIDPLSAKGTFSFFWGNALYFLPHCFEASAHSLSVFILSSVFCAGLKFLCVIAIFVRSLFAVLASHKVTCSLQHNPKPCHF